nr:hypothetical protein [Nocardioides sp. zg-DK7169]
MDLSAPRPQQVSKPGMGIEGVQKWVLSALAVTTIWHMAAALVLFATYIDDDKRASQIGLCVIAGVFGVLGMAAGFAIHRRSPASAWMLLGVLPGVLGVWLVLR